MNYRTDFQNQRL